MDASGLLSGLILAGLLFAYTNISLWQYLPHPQRDPAAGPQILALFHLGFTVAVAISAMALFFSLSWMTWPLATVFAAILLGLLIVLRWLSRYLASNRPAIALFFVPPLHRLPLGNFIRRETTKFGQDLSSDMSSNGNGSLNQDLDSVVVSGEHTMLDERERTMIKAVLRLDEYNARDIMVPRVDIIAADLEDDLSSVVNRMLQSGYSRLPVYKETMDNVVGVIYSRRLTPLLNTEPPWPSLEELMLEPFFVPETKRLVELLSEFQRRRVQLALVVDEHGGIEGLVTLEDLLEEIVGEIEDEFSTYKEPHITSTEDGKLIVDAGTSLNDLEEFVFLKFQQTDVDTIGGLVYSTLGKMPQAGDEVVYKGLRIKVLSIMGRRLRKLQLALEPEGKTGQ